MPPIAVLIGCFVVAGLIYFPLRRYLLNRFGDPDLPPAARMDESGIQRTQTFTVVLRIQRRRPRSQAIQSEALKFQRQSAVLHLMEGEYVSVVGPIITKTFGLSYTGEMFTEQYASACLKDVEEEVGGAIEYRIVE